MLIKDRTSLARGALFPALLGAVFLGGCGGGVADATATNFAGGVQLERLEYGRWADVYAYRRVDPRRADRRQIENRTAVLVAPEVVVGSSLDSPPLVDDSGRENARADYRLLSSDGSGGRVQLLVLWDDRDPAEGKRFDAALRRARGALVDITRSARGGAAAMPTVPAGAALKLTFDRALDGQAPPVRLLQRRVGAASDPSGLVAHRAIHRDRVLIVEPAARPIDSALQLVQSLDGRPPVVLSTFTVGQPDRRTGILDARPGIVADASMGILKIETARQFTGNPNDLGWVFTVDKRLARLAVRGRIPFVAGPIDPATGLPAGPATAPTAPHVLRSGDLISQDVVLPTNEVVHLRAEVLRNEDVGNVLGSPHLGLTVNGGDTGSLALAHVRVASIIGGTSSTGQPVAFQASSLAPGADCSMRVHYYQSIPYNSGIASVTDAGRTAEFVVFQPEPPRLLPGGQPVVRGTLVDPTASVALRFSEPMDLGVVQTANNLLLANDTFKTTPQVSVEQLVLEPKPAALSILATRLFDVNGDGRLLRLTPPLGLYHVDGQAESNWLHAFADQLLDEEGTPLDLYDRRGTSAQRVFSSDLSLDPGKPDNLVASRVFRFESFDEDGTRPGSGDYFGQFTLRDGELSAAPPQRTRRIADGQTIQTILRYDKGECWDGSPSGSPPPPPSSIVPTSVPGGVLYQCPSMVTLQPAPPPIFVPPPPPLLFGGILEPLNPRGARVQMTYREDDFLLSYTDPGQLNLDLEQMYWSAWNNNPVQFDIFDRMTIAVAHSDWRPDLLFSLDRSGAAASCEVDCASLLGGLRNVFADNALTGTQFETLVQDQQYAVNPNLTFQGSTGTKFVPYPDFERSYTWRDSRLVSWDSNTNRAVGLGGAKQPDGVPPNRDRTANVSSPWIQEPPGPGCLPSTPNPITSGFFGNAWTRSDADFRGDRARDHDPIALPLLLDFKVFPDDPSNGVATGANRFQIGYVGPCWDFVLGPGGYYNAGRQLCGAPGIDYPTLRVYSFGGINGQGNPEFVDPANTTAAAGGWIFDIGLGDPNGRYRTTAHNVTGAFGDGHLPWAAADFVRKTSVVTYGFFDTQLPNQHDLPLAFPTGWSGLANKRGLPDFETLGSSRGVVYAVQDLVTVMDPPASAQPPGTSVGLEFRGASSFARGSGANPSGYIYDQLAQDRYDLRGNLLNPQYACEAYRYAMPNAPGGGGAPRVSATGLTPYVNESQLGQIRDPQGLLPRFLNIRISLENNVGSHPATPKLRNLGIAQRMVAR